jgi:hypothetical protein
VIDATRLQQLPEDDSVEEEMMKANFLQLDDTAVQEGTSYEDVGPAPFQRYSTSSVPNTGDPGDSAVEVDIEEGAVLFDEGPGKAEDFIFKGVGDSLASDGGESRLQEDWNNKQVYERVSRERWVQARAESGIDQSGKSVLEGEWASQCSQSTVPVGSSRQHAIAWMLESEHKVDEKSMGYWSMAFPTLIPDGVGDFNSSRSHTLRNLSDWAEHCLWWHDGRFARHPYWKFVVMNII